MGTLRADLAANVLAALVAERPLGPREKKGYARLISKGLPNGSAQRILDADTSVGIDVVAQVAEALGLKPWQLLVPGLNPADPPEAIPKSAVVGWPIKTFTRERFAALTEFEKGMVEHAALTELERIEHHRPRPPTPEEQMRQDLDDAIAARNPRPGGGRGRQQRAAAEPQAQTNQVASRSKRVRVKAR